MRVPVVGILGGIGSGKSTVVRQVEDLRLQIIDADRIGHDLLSAPGILDQLRAAFDSSIFDDTGEVIRPRLAHVVFGETPAHANALSRLNQIIHPAIRQEIQRQILSVPPGIDALIIDAALLLEAGWADQCSALIFIETPQVQRIERVKTNRNWTADELCRREQTQLPVSEKRSRCDYVVDNSGSPEQAGRQMTDILQTIIQKQTSETA